MTSVYNFHLFDFIFELSILFNYTEYFKKTNAILCTITFYIYLV